MSERPRTWAASGVVGLLLGVFILYGIARSQSPYPSGGASANSYAAAPTQPRKPLAPGEIDTARSRVYVHVDKTGFGHEHGVEGLVKSGSLHLGAGQNAGAIEIDMGSFTADSDDARRYVNLEGSTAPDTRTEVTNNMLGTSVLDVKQYPTATFVVTSIQQAPAKRPNCAAAVSTRGKFHSARQNAKNHNSRRSDEGQRVYSRARKFFDRANRLRHHAVSQSAGGGRRGRSTDDLGRLVGGRRRHGAALIRERVVQSELMDEPALDERLHVAALGGLRRINSITRSAAILWPSIAEAARRHSGPLRVLDLACGGGDNMLAVAQYARREKLAIEISGCDISATALTQAQRLAASNGFDTAELFSNGCFRGNPAARLSCNYVLAVSAPPLGGEGTTFAACDGGGD